MQESQTEREIGLDLKLVQARKRISKMRIGLFPLFSLLGGFVIGGCAPAVNVPSPASPASPVVLSICSGTSILGVAGTAFCTVVENICSSATITGGVGLAICIKAFKVMQSNANRDGVIRPAQITQAQENDTYGATSLPAGYREVPSTARDDDGFKVSSALSTAFSQYGLRPQKACGGTTITTISGKIVDCQTQNGTRATWTGGTSGLQGQATWNLVFSTGQTTAGTCLYPNSGTNQYTKDCYEVWQDSRTGLLWSSSLTRNYGGTNGGGVNWCIASGNGTVSGQVSTDADGVDASGTGTNCGSTTYQNNTGAPWSACTETYGNVTLSPMVGFCNTLNGSDVDSTLCGGSGGTWTTNTLTPGSTTAVYESYGSGIYQVAKGYMGALSNPGVRWRLPTKYDAMQAEIDGIRFVMPDMGAGAAGGYLSRTNDGSSGHLAPLSEWSASLDSNGRISAWTFYDHSGLFGTLTRISPFLARCVGRSASQ